MVESVTYYGCEVWLLKRERNKGNLVREMDYLRRFASVQIRKIQTLPLGAKYKKNSQF